MHRETAHRLARRALFGFIVTFVLARVFVFLIMSGKMPKWISSCTAPTFII